MGVFNLNKKLASLDRGNLMRKKRNKKTWLIRGLVVLVILFVTVYLPMRKIYQASRSVVRDGRVILAGIKQENLDQIKTGMSSTKDSIDAMNGSLNWLFWLRFIPFLGGYYSDVKHLAVAAQYEMDAGQQAVAILEPYKNEIGLNGQPTPGQDKIAQAVKVLDKLLPSLDKIEPKLKKARDEVVEINTDKYPESIGSTRIKSQLEKVKAFIIGADLAVADHRDALQFAPSMLGQPEPKTYLLLFQNDKELRATGGFITAYAFLKIESGHLSATTSDDIYRLDEKLLKVCETRICPLTPPAPIVKYLPEANGKPRTAWSMRDSNLSPDLPMSAKEFERMYSFLGDSTRYDGIITIDTQVVEELIALTGPIDVFGTTYSAGTDKRCNCPTVIYELEHYSEVAAKGENDRKAVLGTLMQQVLGKLLSSGADKLPDLIVTGSELANSKHVMFYMHDQNAQLALSKLGWTGEIKSFGGDYLHINDSNFAGGKSNLYVEENVALEITTDSSGNVKDKVTIEYKNPQPFNLWLNGILRDYVRIYVPRGSKLISSKGSDDPVNSVDDSDLNKTYFDAFVTVRPQNSRVLSFEYTTPAKASGKNYPLMIQRQPGAKDYQYIVKLNGRTRESFKLTTDSQFNLPF